MSDRSSASSVVHRNDDCQECGQSVPPGQFHSYDSCILYRYRFGTLKRSDERYVLQLGIEVLRKRVAEKKVVHDRV